MMSGPRSRCVAALLTLLAAGSVADSAAAFAPPQAPVQRAQALTTVADQGTVRQAQRLLNGLGYDAGATDGIAGPMVEAAVRAFQSDSGLDQTGRIDAALLQALASSASPLPAERIVAAPPPLPPLLQLQESSVVAPARPENDLLGETWRVVDDNGGSMVVTFQEGGHVTGPAFADGFNWRQDGNVLWLNYVSPLGSRVTRQGTVDAAGVMAGEAQSDLGPGQEPRTRTWPWQAERLR